MTYYNRETNRKFAVAKHSGDFVFDVRTEDNVGAIDNESVLVIGKWKDYTGSQTVPSTKQQMMYGGMTNKLQGTIAGAMGAKIPNLNEVGQDTSMYRRRRRKIYVNLDENKN